MQKINGVKAEELLRFRHSNPDKNGRMTSYPAEYGDNDIGRMKTQRNFITETIKQTIKAKNIFKIKDIIDIAYEYVETNVPISVIKDYMPFVVNIDTEGIKSEVLPGTTAQLGPQQLWFFEVDKTKTKKLIDELYFSQDSDEDIEDDATDNTSTTNTTSNEKTNTNITTSNDTTSSDITKKEASKIKIEILNGSGSSTTLSQVKKDLTAKGYTISRVLNTTSTAKTTIINKTEVEEKYEEDIKDTLKTDNVSHSSVSSSKVDVTIIIGKDYK